jgi:hypothetical protein
MVAFVAIIVLNAVARGRHDWMVLAVVGLHGAVIAIGVFVLVRLGKHRHVPAARVTATRDGFAVRPSTPYGLVTGMLMPVMAMPVSAAVDGWRYTATRPPTYMLEAAFAGAMTAAVLLGLATVAVMMPAAWRGYTVELTAAGIRSRGLLHTLVVPWTALGPEVGHHAGRVWLVADRPDQVGQRGRLVLGPPERPMLALAADAPLVAEVIRWYLHHPADRAAIGDPAELDRLHARLYSTTPWPSAPPPPVANAPARIGRFGVMTRLVYTAVAVAALAAAADLTVAFLFRDRLLAAERAIAAAYPETTPADGAVVFTTDTVGFATGFAAVALGVTLVLAVLAVALMRSARAGSSPARTGLIALSGLGVPAALCTVVAPGLSLAAEPAAGVGLNLWAASRLVASALLAGIALLVLVLLATSGRAVARPGA